MGDETLIGLLHVTPKTHPLLIKRIETTLLGHGSGAQAIFPVIKPAKVYSDTHLSAVPFRTCASIVKIGPLILTVTFNQLNASLLKISIDFLKNYLKTNSWTIVNVYTAFEYLRIQRRSPWQWLMKEDWERRKVVWDVKCGVSGDRKRHESHTYFACHLLHFLHELCSCQPVSRWLTGFAE